MLTTDYTVREFPFQGADELRITEQINTEVCRLSADPLDHFVRCPDTVVRVAIAGVNPGHGLVVIFERTKGQANMSHTKDSAIFQDETNRQLADLSERLDRLEAKPGHGPKLTPAEQLETNTPSLADKLKEAQRPDDFVPVDPDPRD
jgi:hypothetical protein